MGSSPHLPVVHWGHRSVRPVEPSLCGLQLANWPPNSPASLLQSTRVHPTLLIKWLLLLSRQTKPNQYKQPTLSISIGIVNWTHSKRCIKWKCSWCFAVFCNISIFPFIYNRLFSMKIKGLGIFYVFIKTKTKIPVLKLIFPVSFSMFANFCFPRHHTDPFIFFSLDVEISCPGE